MYTPEMHEFVQERKISNFVSDADILVIRLLDHNDNEFAMLMLEFAKWLVDHENDCSVNPDADGSKYHQFISYDETKQETLRFTHETKTYVVVIMVTGDDFWLDDYCGFDIHYCKDYGDIEVYVSSSTGKYNFEPIYTQKIKTI